MKKTVCVLLISTALIRATTSVEIRMIQHVKNSIENAQRGISHLNESVLSLEGLSSDKVRHLLNNICALPGTSYLEIGVWKGSTIVSALYGNSDSVVRALACDNWSEFGGPKQEFMRTIETFLPRGTVHFYDQNCFTLQKKSIFTQPVTTYFYDGNHAESAQYQAFTYFNDIFAEVFIAIVDDWNWQYVRSGTRKAFKKLGYQVLFEQELYARYTGDKDTWWNGLYVGVIKKRSTSKR